MAVAGAVAAGPGGLTPLGDAMVQAETALTSRMFTGTTSVLVMTDGDPNCGTVLMAPFGSPSCRRLMVPPSTRASHATYPVASPTTRIPPSIIPADGSATRSQSARLALTIFTRRGSRAAISDAFGCPVRDVTEKAHSGSYLLRFPDRVHAIVARVVAASSAFPPFYVPATFDLDPGACQAEEGADLHHSLALRSRSCGAVHSATLRPRNPFRVIMPPPPPR